MPAPVSGRALRPCGTKAAYNRHHVSGEVPCEDCVEAARAEYRDRYQRNGCRKAEYYVAHRDEIAVKTAARRAGNQPARRAVQSVSLAGGSSTSPANLNKAVPHGVS